MGVDCKIMLPGNDNIRHVSYRYKRADKAAAYKMSEL